STQPWSGAAKVHVSIVNWCKDKPQKYYLDDIVVSQINSSLKSSIDVSQAVRLQTNLNKCFQGVSPVGMGFIVTEQQVIDWIKADSKNAEVLKLFSMGANLAQNPHGKPERWIIDFADRSLENATDYELPFEHIKQTVKPERDNNRMRKRKINWWKLGNNAIYMRESIKNLS
ncbi:MAG: class I SAM-dependent DNA methyltransferase, partial [Dolichospermum sp.]